MTRTDRSRLYELARMDFDGVTLSSRERDELEALELLVQAESEMLKDMGPTERVMHIFRNMKLEPQA